MDEEIKKTKKKIMEIIAKPTLLTYKQAKSIVEENGDLLFYESVFEIDGFKISIFNYRLAQFDNFMNPLSNDNNVNALEMRGLTFIFNKDGSLYKRHLMLSKFFNLNQVADSMYDIVKDYTIDTITNKEDGSLIGFIRLPNGKVLARTKMSFESEQAVVSNNIYEKNPNVRKLVNWGLDNDQALFFEYVSFKNRIVLDYKVTELILINGRDNKNGKSFRVDNINNYGVATCKFESGLSLDDLIERTKPQKNKEGVVVKFTNDYMIKIKTQWYCDMHHLNFGVASRENDIIRLTLEEEIDDIIAQLSENDTDKREFINGIIDVVNHRYAYIIDDIDDKMKSFTGDMKVFALNVKGEEFEHFYLGVARGRDKHELIKERILKETTHLKQAQKWVDKYRL